MPESFRQGDLFAPEAPRTTGTLVFDLETQNSFDDVGGRGNIEALKMSVGVTFEVETGRFRVYREPEAAALVDDLLAAKLVVGFNVRRFDFRVLVPYTTQDVSKIRCFDLLESLEQALGFRVKLDNVASTTLGTGKSGHGLQAIEWFRQGEWDKLIHYCKDDVKITAELYLFGKKNSHVFIDDRGKKRKVEVTWA